MKIVKIYGGLGNQMFQYAFSRSLAARTGDAVHIDGSGLRDDTLHNGYELGRVFGVGLSEALPEAALRLSVPPTSLVKRFRRKYLTKRSHYIDKKFGYQPELFALPGDRYFEGYWQSEKYFEGMEADIRRDFAFKKPLDERNLMLLRDLPRPIASLHVRRGDYLKYANLNICGPLYYEKALACLVSCRRISSFVVFSDDIVYCRATLRLGEPPAAFVDWNGGEESWQDMAMMSLCDHHIIANSSFSWWGAWLNANPDKVVVAPAIWNRRQLVDADRYYRFTFDDVVPAGWLRAEIE
ncbi:MAG: alpha-1,2-fucosyltransferase [Rectinemataceae bacterium]|jgi:hypothetical protein